ncbi:molybdopterin-dependent oxidoreductase [Patulibacter minatonensis]|uniref:molybdopterin-dependent oxidoreductase n=1 Tax=Patulibacter minatonensis TaxID=298163 RepID=UPI0004B6D3E0|nr:molybdopterin-dependent oxidoreductase [Patulibacter minatonensis]
MPASDPAPQRPEGRPVGRRAFLGIVGVGISSLVWGDTATRWLSGAADALPGPVRGILPSSGWRIYAINPPYPRYDPATWRLQVDGLVERPRSFSMAELQALPRADQTSDFHCVTGWSVDDVHWGGVRFKDLLAAVGPTAGAVGLSFVSAEEDYVDTLTLQQAAVPDAMLAYEMDHAPISRPHGAPVRVVMPQMYGYKGVKWLQRITVVDRIEDGYWEGRGYDRDAWVGKSNDFSKGL